MSGEILEKMFGVGLSEVPQSEWPEGTEIILKMMPPGSRVVRKPDGSISVFSPMELELFTH